MIITIIEYLLVVISSWYLRCMVKARYRSIVMAKTVKKDADASIGKVALNAL